MHWSRHWHLMQLCFVVILTTTPLVEGTWRIERERKEVQAEDESSSSYIGQQVQHRVTELQRDLEEVAEEIANEISTLQREFKNRLLQDVFCQRVGWDRLCHSVRDHTGVALGLWITFRGQVHPILQNGGSVSLQIAQLVWHILHVHQSQWIPSQWWQDGLSVVVATMVWKIVLAKMSPVVRQRIPYGLIPATLFPFWSLMLEEWTSERYDTAPFLNVLVAVVWTFLGFQVAQIPIPLVASSWSGAVLAYDCARSEIAGNWVHMLRTATALLPPTLRLLRRLAIVLRRPAVLLWTNWSKHMVRKLCFWSSTETKNIWGRLMDAIHLVLRIVTTPIRTIVQLAMEHPLYQLIHNFLLGLGRALRPVIIPLSLAAWGVAVQMAYLQGSGSLWRIFRRLLDPVSFFRVKMNGLINTWKASPIQKQHYNGLSIHSAAGEDQTGINYCF